MANRWCKKCKAAFGGPVCAGGHANFMYTSKIPEGTVLAAVAPAPVARPASKLLSRLQAGKVKIRRVDPKFVS